MGAAHRHAMNRRRFLKLSLKGAGAAALAGVAPLLSGCAATQGQRGEEESQRKVIIVMFGGGTRSSEAIDDPRHRWIPRLWNDMAPRGTLFAHVAVQGAIVHPNCTASAWTGHVEWEDLDWTRPLKHPTVFEILRKHRGRPDTDAWAFVYASILARAAESSDPAYGPAFAANVVEPPTIPRATAETMDQLLRRAAAGGSRQAEIEAARQCAELARRDSRLSRAGLRSAAARDFVDRQFRAWQSSQGTTSHDAFLADCAIAAMKDFAPSVIAVAFGEIDCAHYGSWSRYVEAIARTDELTHRLWRAAEELSAYRGRTLMLILPDHGRELEREGSTGFVHHSDFYTRRGEDEGCRRVWMLALGEGVPAGKRIDRPVPNTSVAATALGYVGLSASAGTGTRCL